jgi:sulfotransferase
MIFLSGLPRTGSTLLTSILSQNPDIHAEGNSAVCQLMWDMQQSCLNSEQLKANRRYWDIDAFVSAIPKIYYRDTKRKIIVDKCRSWTLPPNLEMIKKYIIKDPKIIVMTRPVDEIVSSFERLDRSYTKENLLIPGSEPIMRSLDGVNYAKENNNGEFLFVEYRDLINNPLKTISDIYKFCGWKLFKHNFKKIDSYFKEDDSIYGIQDMHKIVGAIA